MIQASLKAYEQLKIAYCHEISFDITYVQELDCFKLAKYKKLKIFNSYFESRKITKFKFIAPTMKMKFNRPTVVGKYKDFFKF